jgi:hypothetical protein
MSSPTPLLVAFGHHKAASDWARSIVMDVCDALGLRSAYHRQEYGEDLKAFAEKERAHFLIYPNANMELVRGRLGDYRGFHIVRDPRDMAVSAYFSHLNSHPDKSFPRLAEHRETLKKVPKEEGLLQELSRPYVFRCMATWDYAQPHVLELKMEQLIRDPYEGYRRVFSFLGLMEGDGGFQYPHPSKLTAGRLRDVLAENDFKVKADGRKPGEEDAQSHYRKGVPGDWKNHFTERHKEFFKSRYNDLLVKLGYETDDSW